MGRTIVRLANQAADVKLVCAISASDVGADAGELAGVGTIGVLLAGELSALAESRAHVVIDFSAAALVPKLADVAARSNIAIVSGTTGLADEARAALDRAASRVAVLWEPNMSVGVHVLVTLVQRAMAALGPEYDVEIVETHHRQKADAPSGTALRLVEAARGGQEAGAVVHGRQGRPGPRARGEIGVHAVRGGDVIGDHVVHLFGEGERLELIHRATSRDVFAHGALRAAHWIKGRPAGRYTLADCVA